MDHPDKPGDDDGAEGVVQYRRIPALGAHPPPKCKHPRSFLTGGVLLFRDCNENTDVFGRPCSDLLSQALRLSTIGAEEFDGRVRDGIGSWAPRKNHKVSEKHLV